MTKRPPYLKKLDLATRRQYNILRRQFKDQTILTDGKFKLKDKEWEQIKDSTIFLILWLLQDHQNEMKEIQRTINAGRLDIAQAGLEKRLK